MVNTPARSAGKPWVWKAGALVAAGVLSAGCTAGSRAVNHSPPTPAGIGSSAGAISNPGGPPTGSGSPPAPPTVPPAGAGGGTAGAQSSPYITAQDQTAETQDDAAIQQDLAQLNTELSTSDQNSNQGESDVPSN